MRLGNQTTEGNIVYDHISRGCPASIKHVLCYMRLEFFQGDCEGKIGRIKTESVLIVVVTLCPWSATTQLGEVPPALDLHYI
jgi:uncharacterized protein (DUF779 family)